MCVSVHIHTCGLHTNIELGEVMNVYVAVHIHVVGEVVCVCSYVISSALWLKIKLLYFQYVIQLCMSIVWIFSGISCHNQHRC